MKAREHDVVLPLGRFQQGPLPRLCVFTGEPSDEEHPFAAWSWWFGVPRAAGLLPVHHRAALTLVGTRRVPWGMLAIIILVAVAMPLPFMALAFSEPPLWALLTGIIGGSILLGVALTMTRGPILRRSSVVSVWVNRARTEVVVRGAHPAFVAAARAASTQP